MEKVRECGLKCSRDARCEKENRRSERESGDGCGDILRMIDRNGSGKRDEDHRRTHIGMDVRSAHREVAAGWGLRCIGKAFRDQSPSNLSRVQSVNDSDRRMTIGTQASGPAGSRIGTTNDRRHVQELATKLQRRGPLMICHESKMANADEPFR